MTTKVYDCVIFNGEIDLLTLRLRELSPLVDVFVVVESNETFSGFPKTPKFDISHRAIREYAARIRYILVEDMPADTDAWHREWWQRNAVVRGLTDASDDDLILMSDVDEIPRREAVAEARDDSAHAVFAFRMSNYYFYMNYKNMLGARNLVWAVAAKFKSLAISSPASIRRGIIADTLPSKVFENGGWHFSYLMNEAKIKRKIQSFSHQEFNKPDFLSQIDIQRIVSRNADLFDRPGYVWVVVDEQDLPATVIDHKDEYDRYFYKDKKKVGRSGR